MLKRSVFIILAAALIIVGGIVLAGCQKGEINMVITPEQAASLIAENQNNPGFVILDVRTPAEYQSGAIAGAVNIDIYSADFKSRLNQLNKNKKYLVYCHTGNRSAQAAAIMKDLKFKEVYDLSGGVVRWSQEGHPLVKPY